MSMYCISPELISFRVIGSDWYGSRNCIPPAMASAPSSSGPVEAPVNTFTLNFSPRRCASAMRRASAIGTAFGYPEPVNPLIPICDPGWIRAAASSPLITRCAKTGFNTLSPAIAMAAIESLSQPRERESMPECAGSRRAHRCFPAHPHWQCFDGSHAEPRRTVRYVTPVRICLKYHVPDRPLEPSPLLLR